MDGGNPKKVEAARRSGQDWFEEGDQIFQVHFAQWIGLEHREKVHELIQRKVRYLLWCRAQKEEGGNGGAVQQRGKGRMADAARITDERAGSEDRKHTSGGVFVAVDNLWERKKVRLIRSQVAKEESHKHGADRVCEPLVSQGADACGGTRRSVHLQVEICDYVSACNSFKGQLSQMEVVEDF